MGESSATRFSESFHKSLVNFEGLLSDGNFLNLF